MSGSADASKKTLIKTKPRVERRRILVTGGSGFVGSHLCDYLVNRGDYVSTCPDRLWHATRALYAHFYDAPSGWTGCSRDRKTPGAREVRMKALAGRLCTRPRSSLPTSANAPLPASTGHLPG